MTNKEAIEILKMLIDQELSCKVAEAYIVAIKALKQPEIIRCEDCIYLRKSDPLHPDTEWCQRLICGTVNPEFFCADGRRKENKND